MGTICKIDPPEDITGVAKAYLLTYPMSEIRWDDTLYRYNPEKGIIEYRKPYNKVKNKWYECKGTMSLSAGLPYR